MSALARWIKARTTDGPELPVPPVGFTDGTVALRPWRPSDGLDLAELCDDDEIRRWTGVPAVYHAQEAAGRAAFAEAERRAGRGVYLAIVDHRDALLLGAVDLRIVDRSAGVAEVGFLLGARSRGQGSATRAVRLLAGWGFDVVGLQRIELRAHPENAASLAVAERAGFAEQDDVDAAGVADDARSVLVLTPERLRATAG